jgi:hypothetical protein
MDHLKKSSDGMNDNFIYILHCILNRHVITVVVILWNEACFPRLKNVVYSSIGLYLTIHADKNRNPVASLVFRA